MLFLDVRHCIVMSGVTVLLHNYTIIVVEKKYTVVQINWKCLSTALPLQVIAFGHCYVLVPSLQMPNVDEPKEIVNKLREFMEQYKKDKPGPSKGS